MRKKFEFESFVNSEGCKAYICDKLLADAFESFVNLERCKASMSEV